MGFEFWYTLVLIILMSIILIKEWLKTEITIFITLNLLIVGKVITIKEAFAGFSNIGVLSIALLFVIAGALQNTGALNYFNKIVFSRKDNKKYLFFKLLRILFPISILSAFINNTPIVAIFISVIKSWTEKHDYSISKFLIPLSYASILGGMCTLIGSSTILIVHGLLIENGYEGFSFFEISKIGVPAALFGLVFVSSFVYRLLPERKDPIVQLGEHTREFVIELKVTENYASIGKTIEEAGLRHLKGLFLFQIERSGEIIAPAKPDEKIQSDDRLFFTGIPKTIVEIQKTPGLQLLKDSTFNLKQYDSDIIKTFETVISHSSPLIDKNVRESNFREKYGAVIIAIHRSGERINKKIGDIILRPGDTLLLLANRNFIAKWYNSNNFYLISSSATIPSKPAHHAKLTLIIFITMLLLTIFKIIPLIAAASMAAITLILTKCISPNDSRDIIDWKVIVIIASAFGISIGLKNSGLADFFAHKIINIGSSFGVIGALVGTYLLTSFYNTIITSNATAALIFPVALSVATSLGVNVYPFAIAVSIAAAASFATPISYQTNLMVYGPGGYKFTDYIKVGLPLQILIAIVALTLICLIYI